MYLKLAVAPATWYNITTLISLIERGYMKIPSFQRNNFLVIDGQQRLVTIYLFKKQRFPKNDVARNIIRKYLSFGKQIPDSELASDNFEDFKLKLPSTSAQKNQLDKLKYDTLSTIQAFDFKGEFDFNRTIRTIMIKQIAPCDDDSSMFEIFSRLNSGGVMLRPQEIRMSIYYSLFYEKLVRAFAMLDMSNEYKSPLRNFLNEFSKRAMKFEEKDISQRLKVFDDFWTSCEDLPKEAFRNEKNKFVISLFEAVFVDASQGNTASITSVTNRMQRARAILELR